MTKSLMVLMKLISATTYPSMKWVLKNYYCRYLIKYKSLMLVEHAAFAITFSYDIDEKEEP